MNESIKTGLKDFASDFKIGARADGGYPLPVDGVNVYTKDKESMRPTTHI